ncbi:HP0495 family protein [Parendozoicomonas haliclonae]|uniref:UPF0250 protein EHSB41UT_01188 n=1 Tax=Parendozoicomonas haliclonae TaxID=1960125 RepID=A0A1X7AH66_9GAMM|nr:DUF493 domain-containing protein [Parendozoicomonas haliclonae]SMA40398.1 hypothetical protein EHSB41UT_01188 [Parendozoicomonas haliclonae]
MTDVKLTELTEQQEPPKIEFPCDYRISVMGNQKDDFHEFVLEVIKRHAPDHDGTYNLRDSRNGTFVAVVVTINATGPDQLSALHEDLKKDDRVRMVL